jgi:SAM-dependent methyltransferase
LPSSIKYLLNAGSGPGGGGRITRLVQEQNFKEVRLDIDPALKPDITGSILELERSVGPQSFEAVWSSHVLEHLYAHEVFPALRQFHQVLKPEGFALIMTPDLEAVAQFVVNEGIAAIAYHSPSGPIRPLDMLYGHSLAIEGGKLYMAHHTGFTTERLANLLLTAGFTTVSVTTGNFEICALALMPDADGAGIKSSLLTTGFNFQDAA